ncbi:MAG: prepilin-type N-terminal cleavage/methylation domain-containing protein [Chlorobium sp.]|nr:prepilin-type N-terminal cleavage/methylation domain-containing protein [Chlorobium sp.]
MHCRQHIMGALTRQKQGFTLVELMITLAILGILGMIAIPLYNQYVEKAKKSAAFAVLETFPILLESYRADYSMICPTCNAAGTYTYTYTENDTGTVTADTITPIYPAFKAKSVTASRTIYDYQLVITVAPCAAPAAGLCESAVVTALPSASRGAPAGNLTSAPIK